VVRPSEGNSRVGDTMPYCLLVSLSGLLEGMLSLLRVGLVKDYGYGNRRGCIALRPET
jgi:hypothetical protein